MSSDSHPTAPAVPPESPDARQSFAREVLTYFYPVHYRLGMEMERAMSQGRLDRKQAAMLWLVHSLGGDDGWVRRKEVEAVLYTWFDLSSSKISRLLNDLSRGAECLIETMEAPDSGREKLLRLTPAGLEFIDGMIVSASNLLAERMAHISLEEQRFGLQFLNHAFRQVTS